MCPDCRPTDCRLWLTKGLGRMAHRYSLLLFILYLVHSLHCNLAHTNYVTPNHNTTACPAYPCHTLDEYVHNHTQYFNDSNTTFEFLDGIHHLSSSLIVNHSDHLHLRALNGPTATVSICANSNGSELLQVLFFDASEITLQDLTYQNCSYSPESRLEVKFMEVENVNLSRVTFRSLTCTLSLVNNSGSLVLSHVQFDSVKPLPNSITRLLPSLINIDYYNSNLSVNVMNMVIGGSPIRAYGLSVYGCITGPFQVLDSHISDCYAVGMLFYDACGLFYDVSTEVVTIQNTVFTHDTRAILFLPLPSTYSWINTIIPTQYVIINSNFENNGFLSTTDGTVTAYRVQNVTVTNCTFQHNTATALIADQSIIYFYGETIFFNNTGYKGGAIALYELSTMWFFEVENSKLVFDSNTALDVGGAIYVSLGYWGTDYGHACFVQTIAVNVNATLMTFSENSALNGGDDLYGAALDQYCSISNKIFFDFGSEFFKITDIQHNTPNYSSVISSDPNRVCLCANNTPICEQNNTPPIRQVYPGQYFNLSVALVGDRNGTVRGPIYATLVPKPPLGDSNYSLVDELQGIQEADVKKCTELGFAIKATPMELELYLTPRSTSLTNIVLGLLEEEGALKINIFVRPCPLGFIAEGNPPICVCDEEQTAIKITCSITEEVIYRQGRNWIGTSNDINTTATTLLLSKHCPTKFCNASQVALHTTPMNLTNEYEQCNHNRSGILCGQCQPPFSLAIGSIKCVRDCTDRHLALLIVFAAAGVVLVFLIKVLNLTVAQGTINGVIFYANVVLANGPLFYPNTPDEYGVFTQILTVFISWVNLDFGIESCFFYGLDTYIKVWLQFVFPVYILGIALLIIIVSHYSVRASKLLGDNAVPVLATLALLSYAKLLRTILSAFILTRIEDLNGSETIVWQEDGSVEYLKGKHIPLFLVSLVTLVFFLLPFTLLLILHQWLQKASHYRMLRWVTKLKPFFDAYTGPFKNKHRYWVGVLLLARCVLLLVFSFTPSNKYTTTLTTIVFLVAVVLVYLALVGQVYRNFYLYALECSYHLNLIFLSVGTLYTHQAGGNQRALVDTLVGIACLQFILIVIYHSYIAVRRVWRRMKKNCGLVERFAYTGTQPNINTHGLLDDFSASREAVDLSSSKFRESLFEHLSDSGQS